MTVETPPESLTIDQLHDWYRVHMPNDPYFCYIDANNTKVFISRSSLGKAIHRSIDIIRSEIPEHRNGSPKEDPLTVAFLANTDWPSFTAFLYGHIFLTHPKSGRPVLPFLISPRNSAIAIAHLLKEARCHYIWATEGSMTDLAEEALALNIDFKTQPKKFPSFDDLYHVEPSNLPNRHDDSFVPPSTPMTMLHSSGMPRFIAVYVTLLSVDMCIYRSQAARPFPKYAASSVVIYLEVLDAAPPTPRGNLCDITASFPWYGNVHNFHLCRKFCSTTQDVTLFLKKDVMQRYRFALAIQSPYVSPGPISSETFLELIRNTDGNYVFTIPSFLEEWSRDSDTVQFLETRKGIAWGGGPLNREIGTRLYNEGVPLRMLYGGTEFCTLNYPFEQTIEEGHEWFLFRPDSDVALLYTDEDNVFQVIVKKTKTHALTTYNTEVDGIPAFDTTDLVQRHPKNHSLYRIVGRADDQIMLSTGEKTNPGPLENIIRRNAHIKDVLIFGRGRQSNGILVQPTSFEEAESLGLRGFRNLIWSSVEEANTYAPAHSRILKEMILIASASEPFTYTPKETLRRGDVLNTYAHKIEELYKDAENSIHAEIPVPLGSHPDGGWTEDESREYVRNVICTILKIKNKEIGDTDDIFGFGCDSLQATYIRNTLVHALRQVAPLPNIQNLPPNFVYQSPTIDSLSRLIAQASRSEVYEHIDETLESRKKRLENIIRRYTSNWPTHTPKKDYENEEVVLLTGSTGGLGSQLLAQLVQISSVSKIYVLNRPGKKSSLERHVDAFKDRGNDIELLKSSKIVFTEGDTSHPGFALDVNLFEEMRNSVTTIIHNAWNVNFNISLASFEPAIRGVRNLIDFALSSPYSTPPPLLFTSSIGIVKTWVNIPPIEEGPFTDINLLQTSGYGESKWVSERILTIAQAETPLKSVIIRVGQLSGGVNGNWNVHEWFPSIITAGQIIGSLPDYIGAASVVIELRNAPIPFAHIVHPRPTEWHQIIEVMAKELKIPVIPIGDWVNQLEHLPKTEENLHKTQALHLVDFYRGAIPPEGSVSNRYDEVMGLPTFTTGETTRVAEALKEKNLPPITQEDIVGWIGIGELKET